MSEQRPVHRGDGESTPRIALAGDVYQTLVAGEHTGGRYAVVSASVPPGGGPPPHRHSREDENFYVLEGELTFHADGASFKAGPGMSINLPPGSVHYFRNDGSTPARMLITVVPSGFELMVAEIGTVLRDGESAHPPTPDEIQRFLAVAPKYGITIMTH